MSVGTVGEEGPPWDALGGRVSLGGAKRAPHTLVLLHWNMHKWLRHWVAQMCLRLHRMVHVHLLLCVEMVALRDMCGDGWSRRQGVGEPLVHYVLWRSWRVECSVWGAMAGMKSAGGKKTITINTCNLGKLTPPASHYCTVSVVLLAIADTTQVHPHPYLKLVTNLQHLSCSQVDQTDSNVTLSCTVWALVFVIHKFYFVLFY